MQIQEAIRGILGWAWIFLQEDWWFFLIIVTLFSLTVKKIFERLVERRIIWTWIVLFAIGVILFFAIAGYWFNGDTFL
ncbi:MAG: hypothetical protein E4H47_02165 [Parcubacteria group bacterium]|nr:MAG: hypothetical protein E4H47_02165 [Parcubacteria group bacterium]